MGQFTKTALTQEPRRAILLINIAVRQNLTKVDSCCGFKYRRRCENVARARDTKSHQKLERKINVETISGKFTMILYFYFFQ